MAERAVEFEAGGPPTSQPEPAPQAELSVAPEAERRDSYFDLPEGQESLVEALIKDPGFKDKVLEQYHRMSVGSSNEAAEKIGGMHRELSSAVETLAILAAEAKKDPLTGLPNRQACAEDIEKLSAKLARQERPVTIVFVDYQGLRKINEKYGHTAGDVALGELAQALRERTRDYETAYRLDGDQFAVILEDNKDSGDRYQEDLKEIIKTRRNSEIPQDSPDSLITFHSKAVSYEQPESITTLPSKERGIIIERDLFNLLKEAGENVKSGAA